MDNMEENVYAKKYLVSYRYSDPEGKCSSFTRGLKSVNNDQTRRRRDLNKNKSFSSLEGDCPSSPSSIVTQDAVSTKYSLENVQSQVPSSPSPSLSSKHSLCNGDYQEPRLKRLKQDCYELEEVSEAGPGLCPVEVSELGELDKLKRNHLVMETFTDLSSQSDPGWLTKVVAQDHNYNRRRGVQFGGVTVWYFGRQQYSSSVPSQGDVSLGMDWTHHRSEVRQIDTDSDSEDEQTESKKKRKVKRLKALTVSARISLLRSHGILQIDRGESADIERVQDSRAKTSGCDCVGPCQPQTCSCAVNQVQCEVDIEGFPCKCSQSKCSNPQGRRVFNRKEVDMYRWNQVPEWILGPSLASPRPPPKTQEQMLSALDSS